MSKRIDWDVAEVLEYDYTYQWIPETEPDSTTNKLFALKVRSCSRIWFCFWNPLICVIILMIKHILLSQQI